VVVVVVVGATPTKGLPGPPPRIPNPDPTPEIVARILNASTQLDLIALKN